MSDFDKRMKDAEKRWGSEDDPIPKVEEEPTEEERNDIIESPRGKDEIVPMVLVRSGVQTFIGGVLTEEPGGVCSLSEPLIFIEQPVTDPETKMVSLQVHMVPPYQSLKLVDELQVRYDTMYLFRSSVESDVELTRVYKEVHANLTKDASALDV